MSAGITGERATQLCRVSESRLWRLLRTSYESCGTEAWSEGAIPLYITSNASLAFRYARLITSWVKDLEDAGSANAGQPVRILELGCGTGRFTFHLLTALEELRELPILRRHPLRYFATDVSTARLEALVSVVPLKAFFADGRLRTAFYEAMTGELREPGGDGDGPLVVIANYVLDSLPADFFRVQDGKIYETLIEVSEAEDDATLDQLQWRFEHREAKLPYYNDRALDQILAQQRKRETARTILVPTGALEALRNLGRLTRGPRLVLIADKAQGVPSQPAEEGMPFIERHGRSHFSIPLDFDLLQQLVRAEGGEMLVSEQGHEVITLAACRTGGGDLAFPEMRQCFADVYERMGLHSELYLEARLREQALALTLHDQLAVLRLTRFDPDRWSASFAVFARLLVAPPAQLRPELVEALEQISARWFPSADEPLDSAFLVGCAFLRLGEPARARRHLERSSEWAGARPVAEFQLGQAEFACGDREQGAARARRALEADASVGRTLELLGVFPQGHAQARNQVDQMEWQAGLPGGKPGARAKG